MVKEALYGAATTLEIDSAARISLPEHDRKKAHLDREVTVVGGDDRLVIWDRETYAARQAETEISSRASSIRKGLMDANGGQVR